MISSRSGWIIIFSLPSVCALRRVGFEIPSRLESSPDDTLLNEPEPPRLVSFLGDMSSSEPQRVSIANTPSEKDTLAVGLTGSGDSTLLSRNWRR